MRTLSVIILSILFSTYIFYTFNKSLQFSQKMMRDVYIVGCQQGVSYRDCPCNEDKTDGIETEDDIYQYCLSQWGSGVGSR